MTKSGKKMKPAAKNIFIVFGMVTYLTGSFLFAIFTNGDQ